MEDDDDEDVDTKSLNKRRGNGRNDVGQGMRKGGRYREREKKQTKLPFYVSLKIGLMGISLAPKESSFYGRENCNTVEG